MLSGNGVMDFLWLKALHIIAVVTFVGGVLLDSVVLAGTARFAAPGDLGSSIIAAVRRWDQRVTTPLLILVWALGITLAVDGGWFPSLWLQIKLILVLLLSALHGILSGTLWKVSRGHQASAAKGFSYAFAALVVVASVVVLVTTKPF